MCSHARRECGPPRDGRYRSRQLRRPRSRAPPALPAPGARDSFSLGRPRTGRVAGTEGGELARGGPSREPRPGVGSGSLEASARRPGPVARAWTFGALAAGTIAAFAGVSRNGWVSIDDPAYVTDNAHVRAGLNGESVRYFLSHPHGGNWHPLTSVSHLLDVSIFGLDPRGPHLVNLGWHVLSVLLLLLALDRLTGRFWQSAAVAALWAVHPLRVESVAWVAERKDVLSAACFMLVLFCHARFAERPSWSRAAFTFAALALGLLAKPMLVTTPFVLLLLDAWPLRRLTREGGRLRACVLEKAPLFAAAAAVVGATLWTQSTTGAVTGLPGLSLAARLSNAVVSVWRYVGKLLWPAHLAVIYPHPRTAQPLAASAAVLAIALAAWLAWRERVRRPWMAVGGAWFVGMLVPVIGLVQVGRQGWADRYMHLPSIGLLIALVWTAGEWLSGSRRSQLAGLAACGALSLVLGFATARQVARWRDSVTLFSWTVHATGPNPFAELGLGGALMQAGRPVEAVEHLARAVALEPDDAGAREHWVTALLALGRLREARAALEAGLERQPSAENWGRLGEVSLRLGDTAAAIAAFSKAVALAPDAPAPRRRLAESLDSSGRSAEAIEQYEAFLKLAPDDVPTLVAAAWLRASAADERVRDGAAALQLAQRASDLTRPPAAVVEAVLAAAYAEAGDFARAVERARAAIELARAEHSDAEVRIYEAQLAGYRARRPYRLP